MHLQAELNQLKVSTMEATKAGAILFRQGGVPSSRDESGQALSNIRETIAKVNNKEGDMKNLINIYERYKQQKESEAGAVANARQMLEQYAARGARRLGAEQGPPSTGMLLDQISGKKFIETATSTPIPPGKIA